MVTYGKVVEMVFRGNEKSLPFLCSAVFCAPLFPSLEERVDFPRNIMRMLGKGMGMGGQGWEGLVLGLAG